MNNTTIKNEQCLLTQNWLWENPIHAQLKNSNAKCKSINWNENLTSTMNWTQPLHKKLNILKVRFVIVRKEIWIFHQHQFSLMSVWEKTLNFGFEFLLACIAGQEAFQLWRASDGPVITMDLAPGAELLPLVVQDHGIRSQLTAIENIFDVFKERAVTGCTFSIATNMFVLGCQWERNWLVFHLEIWVWSNKTEQNIT